MMEARIGMRVYGETLLNVYCAAREEVLEGNNASIAGV